MAIQKEILMSSRNKNPIYIDYYSHEKSDCYKINLPWTRYCHDVIVLCKVSEGLKKAKKIAHEVIKKHLTEALENEEIDNHNI